MQKKPQYFNLLQGTVREGNLVRAGDHYTRDRSTPRRDSFYGGEEDLAGVIGWEEDGKTTIMFRRPGDAFQHKMVWKKSTLHYFFLFLS